MSKTKFVPEGKLEEAIMKKRNSLIIQRAVEAYGRGGRGLTRPDILATGDPYYNMNLALDAFDFSVRK